MKERILFVDDEINVLDGLRRMLRPMSGQWDMAFAEGGCEALDLMRHEPFNVVVSDIKMPDMDGVQLLTETAMSYPKTIRIALSGYSERHLLLKAARISHQYLSKPCESGILKRAIFCGCALTGLISRLDPLPSMPSIYAELVDEMNSERISMDKIGEIISKDMAMTATILHLVNSAMFGLHSRVVDISKAAALLGLETIKSLVLCVQIFSQFELKNIPGDFFGQLWKHSMATGALARRIAQQEDQNREIIDHTFMAGLLHDLGKLLIAMNLPDQYREIIGMATKEERSFSSCETSVLGFTHQEVGAYLVGLWAMPAEVTEAIAFHHNPRNYPVNEKGPLSFVYIANALEHNRHIENNEISIDASYLSGLKLNDRIPSWQELSQNL